MAYKNFLGGAGTGASVGMTFGPVGALAGGLIGGLGSLLGGGDDQAQEQLRMSQQYLNGAKPNDLTFNPLSPQQYQYQTIQDSPDVQAAQKDYLGQLAGLSKNGLSEQDALSLENMRQAAAQQSRGAREAALTSAQARGMGGGGLEFLMGEQGAQGGMQAARQNAFQQAAQTAQQRAMYNTAYGNALTGQRSQNFLNNQANTDIINNYNKANTDLWNNAQQYNQQYGNQVTQQNNQNKFGWANAMAGQGNTNAGYQASQDAASQANLNTSLGGLAKTWSGYNTDQFNQQQAQTQNDQRQQYLDLLRGSQAPNAQDIINNSKKYYSSYTGGF